MRFGLAVADIVPPFRTPMYGYGARKDGFDWVNDPLTFTALVLEEGGRRALIGAADLCSFPNDGNTPGLLARVAEIVGCPAENVLLNASHTHGGPQLPTKSLTFRTNSDPKACEDYEEVLFDRVLAAAKEAADSLQDGTLWYGEGVTTLPMNRRPERDGQVTNAPNPGGPVDDRMQILALRNAEGSLSAVGMKLCCHPVSTGAQHLLTADYPGAWRAEFSRAFGSKVTPFFLQGAGADARPAAVQEGDHWRQMPHAELPELGRALLAESLDVLTRGGMQPVENLLLEGARRSVVVPCERRFTKREDFQPLLESEESWERRYAEDCLLRLDAGEEIPDAETFDIQTLWLSRDLALIGTNAEPLCALGRIVESAVAPKRGLFLGYTNGCIAYTPDRKEMARGGYEAQSYLFEPWTGPMKPGIEDLFSAAVLKREGS